MNRRPRRSASERRALAYDNFVEFLGHLLTRLSLRQVALRSGVSHSELSRLARGLRKPTLRTAKAVIDAYVGPR